MEILNNTEYEITIDGITSEGFGVGRLDGFAIFVENALPNECVVAKIYELKKSFAYAKLVKIIKQSEYRCKAKCKQSAVCGGCALSHVDYDEQLVLKGKMVEDALKRIAHLDVVVGKAVGMDYAYEYRNKGVFHVDYSNGKVSLGFFEKGSHNLIKADECLLFSKDVNALVKWLEEAILREGRVNYINKVMIRESKLNGELMVVFVTEDKAWRLANLVDKLAVNFKNVASVYHNVNSNKKVMLGKSFKLLYGRECIVDSIGELKFNISPQSFFQINNLQAKVLYDYVREFANINKEQVVADVYCGIGTIAMYVAKDAKMVYGVESVPQAIKDAKENCALNGIDNCIFEAAKAEVWLPKWVKQKSVDVVIVDPPRSGCHQFLLDALESCGAKTVVYVSCNAATLARDVAYLCKGSFVVDKIQAVDMFGHSSHVEAIILMTYCGDKAKNEG